MDEARNDSPRRVLVTGACGFIGANVCHYFVERAWQVVGLEGPNGLSWRLPPHPRLRTEQVDLLDAQAVAELAERVQPHLVVNCAAFGAYSNQTDAERIYRVNVLGLRHLLEAAKQVKNLRAFVHMGSSSEYGTNCQAPHEDAPCWPDSDYAVSKVAATALTRFFAIKHNVPAFTLRLYSVYGPYEDMSRLIPQLTLRARQGGWPPLVNPDISRDFVYVDDVRRAIALTFERAPQLKKGDVFNIGSGICCTLKDLVGTAQEAFRVKEAPKWGSMPARHWDHAKWYGNPAHALDELSWQTEIPLHEGLQKTMSWIQQNPALVEEALRTTVLGALR